MPDFQSDAFVRELKTAFPPGDAGPVIVCDRPDLDSDYAYVYRLFRNRTWIDVDFENLQREYDGDVSACVFFMMDDVFTYFLPAFMRGFVTRLEDGDLLLSALLHRLGSESILNGLSKEQVNLLKRFLRYVHETGVFQEDVEDLLEVVERIRP